MEIFCWLNPVPAVSIMLAPWPRLSILIIFGAELKKRGGGNNYVWRVLGQATVDITRLPSPLAAAPSLLQLLVVAAVLAIEQK